MKDKLFKIRKHVDWKTVLDHLEDFQLNSYFLFLKSHTKISDNRLAYLTLLHYYDKRCLDYFRLTSDYNVFIYED